MITRVPPSDCTRAREDASALLDGELSELAAAYLEAHLRGCPECRAYADEIGAVAARLRAEPLVEPEIPLFVPGRRRAPSRLNIAAAAAALVLASGSAFAAGHMLGSESGGSPTATGRSPVVGLSIIRRAQLIGMLRTSRPSDSRPGHAIAL